MDAFDSQIQNLISGSNNSISACQSAAFIIYNQNFAFEQEIVNNPCFVLSTSTSSDTSTTITSTQISTTDSTTTSSQSPLTTTTILTTTTACPLDFSQFDSEITTISSNFDTSLTSLLAEETQLSNTDYTLQKLFADNGVSPECTSLLNQITPVDGVHNAFLACIDSVVSNKTSATTTIEDKLNSAISNCQLNVS